MSGVPTKKKEPRVQTFKSEGTEGDVEFQQKVAELEEMNQRQGWLFGKGAYDKGDLLYLRDFNTQQRYQEVEIEDKEREIWERERARAEVEVEAAARAALSAAASAGTAPQAMQRRGSGGPPGIVPKPAPVLLPVKVKPVGAAATAKHAPPSASAGAEAGQPPAKRPRNDSLAQAQLVQPQQPAAQGKPAQAVDGNSKEDSDDGEGGLAGLLGGYGSTDESEDGGVGDADGKGPQDAGLAASGPGDPPVIKPATALPSADILFGEHGPFEGGVLEVWRTANDGKGSGGQQEQQQGEGQQQQGGSRTSSGSGSDSG